MRLLLNFLLLLLLTNTLSAHQTGLSYLDIKEDERSKITVVYKKPLVDTQADDIFIRYPSKCIESPAFSKSIEDGFIVNKYTLWCTKDGLMDSRIWVDGLVASDRGVLIRYEKNSLVESALLRSTTPFIHINHTGSKLGLFAEYLDLGIVHILVGFDHLLFVLSLLLLASNFKTLLYSITGFTISHSITLVFSVLGVVSINILFIEAMIALSILFLAREIIVANQASLTRRYLGGVAFIFGLLHGFGFSSVLASIGLPQDEIPLSLFAFNLGIELGQLIFIFGATLLYFLIKKYIQNYQNSLKTALAYIIGGLSSFWFIERVISF